MIARCFALAGLAAAGLLGCLPAADPQALLAREASPKAMGCAACHLYPLRDAVHRYHLETAEGNKRLNGPITCLDCHPQALRGSEMVFLDTIFINAFDLEKSSYDLPTAASIRLLPILRIDTLRQSRPIPLSRSDTSLTLAEWMTGLAHLNGRVDVEMHVRDGVSARYDIRAQTCSAVACHHNVGTDVYPLVGEGGAKRAAGRDRP